MANVYLVLLLAALAVDQSLAQPLAHSFHHVVRNIPDLERGDAPLQYYISVVGDDSKSGKTPVDAFASFDRALAEVRNLKHNSSGGQLPTSVYFNLLADGDNLHFPLKDTVLITPQESGQGSEFVVFRNHDPTKVL